MDIDLIEVLGDGGAGIVYISRGGVGGRIAIGDHIGVVVPGRIFHPGDKPDLEIETVAKACGAVGESLVAEIPFHQVFVASGRNCTAGIESGRGIGCRVQVHIGSFAANNACRELITDHEVAQQRHWQQGVEPVFNLFTDGNALGARSPGYGRIGKGCDPLGLGLYWNDTHIGRSL